MVHLFGPRYSSCGLFVVSTAVGGVPEVLPSHMVKFAEPTVEDLVEALTGAIALAQKVVPSEFHTEVYYYMALALFEGDVHLVSNGLSACRGSAPVF